MIDKISKKDCTGCYGCQSVCPVNAISMDKDNEGFAYPIINYDKCTKCNLCEIKCPLVNKFNKIDRFSEPIVYAAWNKDKEIRLDSTSGGIFSELANHTFENSGFVSGAIFSDDWNVEHIITNEKDLLKDLRSSKYVQSSIEGIYISIKKILREGKKVFFCGTPCHVAALYNVVGNSENLVTCDFICRGVNSPKAFLKYLEWLEKKYDSKVTYVKFKNKKYGWHNFSTKIKFENGKIYNKDRYTDKYMRGYLEGNCYMRPSCHDCKFKSIPSMADITLADFWGIENINPKLDNNHGTSLVMINSEKGKKLFESLDKLFYKECNFSDVIKGNPYLNKSPKYGENRDAFLGDLDTESFDKLVDKYLHNPSIIKKLKYVTKRTISRFKML
ncbi:Coenzyme F420 hydrogenase/dehydrogenase, beta subunit C-terminal domain [Clostridium intestinale]|uniref:Coenzyme F420 hydrogenase/dehydrogenase, beta subunit C-terminal domain n=1 Tax=Clostridium intestinale TaxID=36845 RepID=UPI0028E69AF6|nr:Coenzyme F420 hydrogenase/dehydrogenase, beta subunit C-terminal domain [Clostridium intestinale]